MKKIIYLLLYFSFFNSIFSQTQTVGLFTYESDSYNGYTLFNPLRSTSVFLIDNCGRLVNEWESDFLPGQSSYLLEDGTLLRTAKSVNNTNPTFIAGGGGERVQKLDWNNNLIWEYTYSNNQVRMHHDIEPLPNGNILILAWELKTTSEAIAAGRDPNLIPENTVWGEHIIEIQPEGTNGGTIVWEWYAWDHLIQDFDSSKSNFGNVSEHPELIDLNFVSDIPITGAADWLHFNAIDYNLQRDEIIMSSPSTNEIYIIDHSTTTSEAASHSGGNRNKGGDILYRWGNPLAYQRGTISDQQIYAVHDVRWIENGLEDEGKIMFFNNGRERPNGNYSSVDIIEPPIDADGNYLINSNTAFAPQDIFWTYIAPNPTDFYSSFISGAQRLPNGNTLVCSGGTGHFFEINPSKEIVWEYVNPVLNGSILPQGNPVPPAAASNSNMTFRCTRYRSDFPGFQNVDLTSGNVLELNPLQSSLNCDILTSTSTIEKPEINIFPNPTRDFIFLKKEPAHQLGGNKKEVATIYDLNGKILLQKEFQQSVNWDVSILQQGIYIIKIGNYQPTKLTKLRWKKLSLTSIWIKKT